MNQLIEFVAAHNQLTKKKAREVIESTLAGIVTFSNLDGSITLREFGRFELKRRKARVNLHALQGKDSDTKKPSAKRAIAHTPAKEVLTFTCSPTLVREL